MRPIYSAVVGLGLVATLALAPPAVGAQSTELMGSWRIDLDRSEPRLQGPPLVDTLITLTAKGNDVSIVRVYDPDGAQPFNYEALYITDGKPQDVVSPSGRGTLKVRTRWRKQKLSLSYTASPRDGFDLDVTETWQVTKRGELQITQSTRVSERTYMRKEIYVRAAAE